MIELTPDEHKILVDAIQDSATVVHKGRKDMNERIRQLAEQAGLRFTQLMSNPMVPVVDGRETDLAKFAELIVQECVGVVEGGSFLHDQAPTAIFARECSGAIKRHFGVEE